MMKHFFSLCLLLILVGCTESSIEDNRTIVGNEEFYATFEGTGSRTYVDEQIRMRWNAEDKITIFKKNTYNRTFMFTGKTGANAGGFTQVSVDDDYWFGYDVDYSYAVYPHSAENALDETDLYLTVNMPTEQTYVENSFGLNANTMVAISESNQLVFKNVGSYLRVRLYGDYATISSITLTSKGDEGIAGKAKIIPSMEGNPICEMTGTSKSICLTCTEPVAISSDANTPTDFWIVVPPVTLANGFSITVENRSGNTQVYDVNQSFTFERNKYYDMVREVEIKDTPTIHVENAGTLSSLISDEDKYTITSLKLSGELNGTDIKFIRENMLGCTLNDNGERSGSLKKLDLSDVTIVEGGDAYYYSYNSACTTKYNVLGGYMFTSSKTLESVVLPKNTTAIYYFAFDNCTKLSNVVMYGNVKTISQHAFSNCYSLNEIVIPEGVETIEMNAFYWLLNLKKVTIPKSVTSIGLQAFYGTVETDVHIQDLQKFIKACSNSGNIFSSFRLFLNNMEVNDLVIPEGTTEVCSFASCSSLTSVTFPEGSYCKFGGTFQNCSNLVEAKFPNSYQIIAPGTFESSGLTTMTIGNNVTSIFYGAFSRCPLKEFYCYTQTPPVIDVIPTGVNTSNMPSEAKLSFGGINKDDATLYVPSGCKSAYESSDWSKYFGEIKEMN